MTTAAIWAHPSNYPGMAYALSFDYDPDLVAALKANIPGKLRAYDPQLRTWHVADVAWPVVERIAETLGIPIERTAATPSGPSAAGAAGDYAVLHLLPSAPPCVVKAAYKALAKAAHPDHGGDVRTMQRINAAAARLLEGGDR